MDLAFPYQKKRSEFGRQCMFNDKGPDLIDNYISNKKFIREYVLRDPVECAIQNTYVQAEHELNTYRAEYTNGAMNHIEGGWPKDVNTADEEQTKRYKRKVEKDENYPIVMGQLCRHMEECILQNNAINIYQQYYTDVEPTPVVEPSSARTVNVFQDQLPSKRPVSHVSWSPDGGTKIAISHCNMLYQAPIPPNSNKSYIWELENPNTPHMALDALTQTICLEYHQKEPHLLISGQFNGQVAFWDLRKGPEPVEYSLMEITHRDPVHDILWINSKSGAEFFSASTDGTIKWWDYRKLNSPLETLIIDMVKAEDQNISNAWGCTVLEYEPSIPTKFMLGCENGVVISGNRKGKAPLEKMIAKFSAHSGPVLSLERNPAFVKNFLSIGDWTARIWSEDCKESSIMWSYPHRCRLLAGAWSPTRFSVFFTCRSDGIFDVWDILQSQQRATIGVKVCDEALTTVRVHEHGRLTCVANQKGTTYIIELSENLTFSNKNDKMLLTAMFERETRREKILEARNRELRLKQKVRKASSSTSAKKDIKDILVENNVLQAQKDFYDIIENETNPPEEEEEEGEEDLDLSKLQIEDDPEPEPEKKE